MVHSALVLKFICNICNMEAVDFKLMWVEINLPKFLTTERIKKKMHFFAAIERMTFKLDSFQTDSPKPSISQ